MQASASCPEPTTRQERGVPPKASVVVCLSLLQIYEFDDAGKKASWDSVVQKLKQRQEGYVSCMQLMGGTCNSCWKCEKACASFRVQCQATVSAGPRA